MMTMSHFEMVGLILKLWLSHRAGKHHSALGFVFFFFGLYHTLGSYGAEKGVTIP